MKIEIRETTVSPERDSFGYGPSHYRVTVNCVVDDKESRSNSCVLPGHVVFSDNFDHVVSEMKTSMFLDALNKHTNNLVRLRR